MKNSNPSNAVAIQKGKNVKCTSKVAITFGANASALGMQSNAEVNNSKVVVNTPNAEWCKVMQVHLYKARALIMQSNAPIAEAMHIMQKRTR